jgi:hypothetical protein
VPPQIVAAKGLRRSRNGSAWRGARDMVSESRIPRGTETFSAVVIAEILMAESVMSWHLTV